MLLQVTEPAGYSCRSGDPPSRDVYYTGSYVVRANSSSCFSTEPHPQVLTKFRNITGNIS
jgi:hypothetical protein